MIEVYRVQSADGRGPWKPGLSKHWIDMESDRPLQKDVISAFGLDWRSEIPANWSCGCACRSMADLLKWFTPLEQSRLSVLGYVPVMLKADRVVRENTDQLIFARRMPLREGYIIIPWPSPMIVPWRTKSCSGE